MESVSLGSGYLLQQLVDGVAVGCVYGLVAMGYTMVHGIIGQINLAHGEVFMMGAFTAFIAFVVLGVLGVTAWPVIFFVALAVAAIAAAAHGWTIHRVVYRPLRRAPGFAPLVATIGLALFLREYVRLLQSSGALWLAPDDGAGFVFAGWADGFSVALRGAHVLILCLTLATLGLHWAMISRTGLGRAQRACAQDLGMAALSGMNVERTIGLIFAMAGLLAALAGAIVTVYYGVVDPYMGFLLGLKAVTAAILGGIGSLPGAVLGGLLIGLFETFWSAYLTLEYRDVAVFALLVGVLVFRPSGILSRPVIERLPGAGQPST